MIRQITLILSLGISLNMLCVTGIDQRNEAKIIAQEDSQTKPGRWSGLTKNITGTLLLGLLIGSLYGASCAHLEQNADFFLFAWPLSWVLFICMKHATLEGIMYDARRHNIECHRSALYNSAWISDWLAYLYCYKGPWPHKKML